VGGLSMDQWMSSEYDITTFRHGYCSFETVVDFDRLKAAFDKVVEEKKLDMIIEKFDSEKAKGKINMFISMFPI
jgi:hypothetical protein